jgi:hypothetical protein
VLVLDYERRGGDYAHDDGYVECEGYEYADGDADGEFVAGGYAVGVVGRGREGKGGKCILDRD